MLRVAGIQPSSIVDGPGFRYTLFLQGCSHHCDGCHNPATWDKNGGKEMTVEDILADIKKEYYIDGVTVSGGEPLEQAKELKKLLYLLKEENYHIVLFSGYTFEQIKENENMATCLAYVDVLIDGEYKKDLRSLSLRFRGSENQRVIDVPESLSEGKTVFINWDGE